VLVDGTPQSKAGLSVPSTAVVQITADDPKCAASLMAGCASCDLRRACRYVCRAGYKLEAALDKFGVDVTGAVALDAGLSTGGFTDCLLQRGAARVYGIDVGYGQARVLRGSELVL